MITHALQRLSILAVALLITMSLSAQTIDWGDDIETNKLVAKFVGETEDGHYALAYKSKFFYLEKYEGSSQKLAWSTKLELPMMNGKKTKMGNVYLMEDQIILFTYQYLKSEKKYNVYGYTLGEKGKIPTEHTDILSTTVEKKSRQGDFYIKLSRDKSKMLLIHAAPYKKPKGKDNDKWVVNMRVLTPSLFTIKEMEEEFPIQEERDYYSVSSYVISNEGGVYVAVRKTGWDRKRKLTITKEMNVYMYDPSNGFEVRKIPVDLGPKSASSILLDIDRDGNLVGGGFYGERTPRGLFKYEGIKGSYYIKINRVSEQVEVVNTEDFSTEFTAQILKEKSAAKGRLVPNNFIPRKIILREDGGAVFIAEYYVYTSSSSGGGGGYNTRTGASGGGTPAQITEQWLHGPIVVASISPEGKQEWVRAIPKNQFYSITRSSFFNFGGTNLWINIPTNKNKIVYHSMIIGVSEAGIHLIYNDNPKNVNLKHFRDTKRLIGYTKAVPVSVTISPEGEVEKEILADRDRKEVVLRPKIFFQDDYGYVLIYGNKRKKDKFGKITF
ncbi:MAG: hypothetical protein AB8F95_04580 [Bacteroidia bacterium]